MNIFARRSAATPAISVAANHGLRGRVLVLVFVLLCEGVLLASFASSAILTTAIPFYISFSLFVNMSNGATYAVVPMINKTALGSVAGIVGAGGNVGAVMAGLLFSSETLAAADAFLFLGFAVIASSAVAWCVRFSPRGRRKRTTRDGAKPRCTRRGRCRTACPSRLEPLHFSTLSVALEAQGRRHEARHVIVIGNGMVGQRFCAKLLEFDTPTLSHRDVRRGAAAAYDRVQPHAVLRRPRRRRRSHWLATRSGTPSNDIELHIGERVARDRPRGAPRAHRRRRDASRTTTSCSPPARPRSCRRCPGIDKPGVLRLPHDRGSRADHRVRHATRKRPR